jgi:hypothetical protein
MAISVFADVVIVVLSLNVAVLLQLIAIDPHLATLSFFFATIVVIHRSRLNLVDRQMLA